MMTSDGGSVPADDLTGSQRAAVEHFEGPLLVLAGPGSGKTRVITRRIARLIERGVKPWEILAITFTNKAARAMSERVHTLLPGSRIWVSTFHRFCAKLLREHGRAVGLNPNFSIYDTGDQQQLIRQLLHDLNFDSAHFPANKINARISQAKNELLSPEKYITRYGEGIGTHLEAVVAKVYPAYQKRLLEANAVDFDDLLVHVAMLLAEQDPLRVELDQRYRFILVDEYQDTNQAQYQIVTALSQIEPNLCATGDPDQSIYGWRGARIENILRFEHDFPAVTMIRLEENFRSTPEILKTADRLIGYNIHRKAKRLKTDNVSGEAVELRLYRDGQHEANSIANEIAALIESGERRWKDFAVFYRVNALSRSLETAFSRQRIPYQMAGGVAFYERVEIKDLLAYLRLIENPQDRIAFLRVVNTPTRGIGKRSLEKLVQWADGIGWNLIDASRQRVPIPALPKRAAVQLRTFAAMVDELSQANCGTVEALLQLILKRTGYLQQLEASPDEMDSQRVGNIEELISAARQYDEQEPENDHASSLTGFLETATLTQDIDSLDESTGTVTLMTLHAAKGLEFPCVYLLAVEQNILPHERSLRQNDARQLEEERRLLFVGMTRAEEKLVLTHTVRRELHGRSLSTIPSVFHDELTVELRDLTGAEDFQFLDSTDHDLRFDRDDFSNSHQTDDEHETSMPSVPELEKHHADGEPWQQRKPPVGQTRSGLRLTTGAALKSGTKQSVELQTGFAIGMQVRHPRYGLGTVIETSGLSKNRTVTVEFAADARRECFVAAKCPLQPIGLR